LLRRSDLDGRRLSFAIYRRHVTPRRSRYPCCDESHIERWIVVYDMVHTLLEHERLPVGSDLHAAIQLSIEKWTADGWNIESDGRYGFFFCNRGGARREIRIQACDPSKPVPLNNTAAACKGGSLK
jgi:hypothetical protein